MILFIFSLLTFLFLSVPQVSASTTYGSGYYDAPPAYTTTCNDTSGCNWKPTCWNSWAPGQTDCGDACSGGDAWTKYDLLGCYVVADDGWGNQDCETVYVESASTCSTADKYNYGNLPVLRGGSCNCEVYGEYKTCCNGTTLVDANPVYNDPYDPPEAECPAGSEMVYCGQAGQPSCGQDACGIGTTPCTEGEFDYSECVACNTSKAVCKHADCTQYYCTGALQSDPGCASWCEGGSCPNGACDNGETCSSCSQDCGACANPTPTTYNPPPGSCGGAGQPACCDPNQVNMLASPNPVNLGNTISFNVSGSQGSTHLGDSWSGGVDCVGGFWGGKTCNATNGGNYTWTHYWKNCAPNDCGTTSSQCSKQYGYTVNTVCPSSPPTGLTTDPLSIPCGTTQVTLKWTAPAYATLYYVRVDDGDSTVQTASGPVSNNCGSGVTHDVCINEWTSNSMTINVSPGRSYTWWVHAGAAGCGITASSSSNFTVSSCAAPTPTPYLRVNFTDTTGAVVTPPSTGSGPVFCTYKWDCSTVTGSGGMTCATTSTFTTPVEITNTCFGMKVRPEEVWRVVGVTPMPNDSTYNFVSHWITGNYYGFQRWNTGVKTLNFVVPGPTSTPTPTPTITPTPTVTRTPTPTPPPPWLQIENGDVHINRR